MPSRNQRLEWRILLFVSVWVLLMVSISSRVEAPLSMALAAIFGVVPCTIAVVMHERSKKNEANFTRVARELNVLENYLCKFIYLEELQAGVDRELSHLAELCSISQKKLKLLSEGGLQALGFKQDEDETDSEYIERAKNRRKHIEWDYQEAIRNFEASYDHAEMVRRVVRISLKRKDFLLYLKPADNLKPAA